MGQHQSRSKLEREQIRVLERELQQAGVREYTFQRTMGNHMTLRFYCGGKPIAYTFAPSGDWRVRTANKIAIRRMLRSVG